MCFLSSLSLTEWMLILTTIFTGGLLCVAWLAYNKLLVQEASKKQLEIVSNVITDIVYSGIKILTHNYKGPSIFPIIKVCNIFSFASLDLFKPAENYGVIISKTIYEQELYKIIQHLGNPLLPPKIAISINALRSIAFLSPVNENQSKVLFYVLGSDDIDLKTVNVYSQFKINDGINGWLQACKNLQAAIMEWYKSKGVKEINHLALATKTL